MVIKYLLATSSQKSGEAAPMYLNMVRREDDGRKNGWLRARLPEWTYFNVL